MQLLKRKEARPLVPRTPGSPSLGTRARRGKRQRGSVFTIENAKFSELIRRLSAGHGEDEFESIDSQACAVPFRKACATSTAIRSLGPAILAVKTTHQSPPRVQLPGPPASSPPSDRPKCARPLQYNAPPTTLPLPCASENSGALKPNQPERWRINTRKCMVVRIPTDKLGLTVYSEKGRFGTRVDRVRPFSVAEVAGIKAEDVFVKIGGEFVLHYNHAQLVEKLATQPLSFSVELTDGHQMPKSRGKYLIEICDSIPTAMDEAVDRLAGPAELDIRTSPTLILPPHH